ncbi:hypothetical protein AV530_006449 [Patagioenas fasciata monilis]|uniref:Uncharacterized protein n=1 Tax=Patagioenas fasciata monilis TaxID=372326 RepID=A0A1V4KGH9_PATFA|nr:hypothetical protein AV530_006449 [Patagioenas fasciata monilis]
MCSTLRFLDRRTRNSYLLKEVLFHIVIKFNYIPYHTMLQGWVQKSQITVSHFDFSDIKCQCGWFKP